MQLSNQSGLLKKFRRTPWRFQRTFRTPLSSLEPFTSVVFDSLGTIKSATLVIDSVAMQPLKIEGVLSDVRQIHKLLHDSTITAETSAEAKSLLLAALGDWVDFLFIPSPKPFVLYADHDEYCTFFANTKSNLHKVTEALTASGFEAIEGYVRKM